jgi:hypothetical protein
MEQKTQDCTTTNRQPQHITNPNTTSEPTSPLPSTLASSTSAEVHVQPHHTSNPTIASAPIRTFTPPRTPTSTDTLQPTPIVAILTPRISGHNFPWSKQSPLLCPNCDLLFNDEPNTKENSASKLRSHFNSDHPGSQMNDPHLQIHVHNHSSRNFHWCPSKK